MIDLAQPTEMPDARLDPRGRPAEQKRTLLFYLVFAWGVCGVLLLFVRALLRLTPLAWQPIKDGSLSALQIGLYAAWVVFNAYAEGYRAFQKAFCPRVVARAYHLAQNPKLFHALLAPAYCLSLFHANRRGLTVAWVMLAVIALLVWLLGGDTSAVARDHRWWRGHRARLGCDRHRRDGAQGLRQRPARSQNEPAKHLTGRQHLLASRRELCRHAGDARRDMNEAMRV